MCDRTKSGLIDVVIPAYNAAEYIQGALESVVAQGQCVSRVIVVDDGSTDSTRDVVALFAARHAETMEIKYLHQTNQGPSAARNLGLREVRSEFVAMLDADDIWVERKLQKQLEVFFTSGFKDLGLVYCGYGLINQAGNIIENLGFRLDLRVRGDISRRLLRANLIAGSASAVLMRRECLDKVGGFDDTLVCAEDWDLWLRIAEHYKIDYVDEELVFLRQHPSNSQKDEARMLGGTLLFLNKLYLRRKIRWHHVLRFWKRLELSDYPAVTLQGFESCHPKIKALMCGHHMIVFKYMFKLYMRFRGISRRIAAEIRLATGSLD